MNKTEFNNGGMKFVEMDLDIGTSNVMVDFEKKLYYFKTYS
jgi:hypothetical protein